MKFASHIFAGLTFVLLLAGCNRSGYPTIKDANALQRDCIGLLEKFPVGEIAKDQWPRTVAALGPVQVEREGESIRIWTHQERGRYANGYYVFRDGQLSPPSRGVWIKKTKFTGVYRFEMGW